MPPEDEETQDIKASDLRFKNGIWEFRTEVVERGRDKWVPLASVDAEAAAFLSFFDEIQGDPDTDEIILLRLADPKNPQWITIAQAQELTAPEQPAVKGYATAEDAQAVANPDEVVYQLPDGSFWLKKAFEVQDPQGYRTKEEAENAANPDETVFQLPDGSFWLKPAFEEPQLTGYASQEEADAAVAGRPDLESYQVPDGSWALRSSLQAPEQQGYATQADAEAAIANRTDLEAFRLPDGSFSLRARQAQEPGEAEIVQGADVDPSFAGRVFQRLPDGTLREIQAKPKPTTDQLLAQAFADGDVSGFLALQDLLDFPTSRQQFELALQFATSPADYNVVIGMARGEIPIGPIPRAADTLVDALKQIFPGVDAPAKAQEITQSIEQEQGLAPTPAAQPRQVAPTPGQPTPAGALPPSTGQPVLGGATTPRPGTVTFPPPVDQARRGIKGTTGISIDEALGTRGVWTQDDQDALDGDFGQGGEEQRAAEEKWNRIHAQQPAPLPDPSAVPGRDATGAVIPGGPLAPQPQAPSLPSFTPLGLQPGLIPGQSFSREGAEAGITQEELEAQARGDTATVRRLRRKREKAFAQGPAPTGLGQADVFRKRVFDPLQRGEVLPRGKSIFETFGVRPRSEQAIRRLTIPERQLFTSELEKKGIAGPHLEEFRRLERAAAPGGPRRRRISFAPPRI